MLRTISKFLFKIDVFFAVLLYFSFSFDANLHFQKFFKNVNFLHFSVTLHLGMVLDFRCTNLHFYSIKTSTGM